MSRRLIHAVGALLLLAGVLLAVLHLWRAAEPEIDAELQRQIGQMLMVGFVGTSPDDPWPRRIVEQIAEGSVGGVLILGRNVSALDDLRAMNNAFREAAPDNPPLIAIDQEGGRIQRLRSLHGFPETPSAAMLGRHADPETARDFYATMAQGLADLGFNVNFGPVVDLDVESRNPIISQLQRAYAPDAPTVTAFARAFIEAHRSAGILTAPKHFPGHGSTLLDSHETLPDITLTWSEEELEPYRALLAEDSADMVMVGHLVLDREGEAGGLPATLSSAIATGMLRDRLGFAGVIVSDDMEMGAIVEEHDLADALIMAIEAGIDLLIVSNYRLRDPDLPERLIRTIGTAAMQDEELRARIAGSATRIEALRRDRREAR
ncbi:MAG: glycoside hydrolase family 3 N-terminal domain-containing protein [Rhizobiaceae bacterium]